MSTENIADGITALPPREKMTEAARKLRDTYAMTPGIPFLKREFDWNEGYFGLDKWHEQGMPKDVAKEEAFDLDEPGNHMLSGCGWIWGAFVPEFEKKTLEIQGDHELVQDPAGRKVLYFKGQTFKDGVMPTYVDHPVKDMKTWTENVKWRLDPAAPGRFDDLEQTMQDAKEHAGRGEVIMQYIVGGYMYLRALFGSEDLCMAFYDMPEVIHDCMEAWLKVTDAVIARHQEHLTIDEFFFDEDICYNHGLLISPNMVREFLVPYYQQLISNVRTRQIDKVRPVYFHFDSDGYVKDMIPMYMDMGMNIMSPFEAAAGSDIVEMAREFPGLVMTGGIDKRAIAAGKEEIDRYLERVLPPMCSRGGYIPTCDHGVPEEVSYENYLYYRKRAVELGS